MAKFPTDPKECALPLIIEVIQNVLDSTMNVLGRRRPEGSECHGMRAMQIGGVFERLHSHFDGAALWVCLASGEALEPLLLFTVEEAAEGTTLAIYQFGHCDMVDARLLLPMTTSTKRSLTEDYPLKAFTAGQFGVGLKQLVACVLMIGARWSMHGSVPAASRDEVGADACGIRAVSALETATVEGELCGPPEWACALPDGVSAPDVEVWLRQTIVFPAAVPASEVWRSLRRSHFVLERLWPADGCTSQRGAHVLPLHLLLPNLVPESFGQQIFYVKSRSEEARTFLNGVSIDQPRHADEPVRQPYHTLIFVDKVAAFVNSLRDYGDSHSDYLMQSLKRTFWKGLARLESTDRKTKLLCAPVHAPDLWVAQAIVRSDCYELKEAVAALSQGPPMVIKWDLESLGRRFSPELVEQLKLRAACSKSTTSTTCCTGCARTTTASTAGAPTSRRRSLSTRPSS